jgi:hypothetical protein
MVYILWIKKNKNKKKMINNSNIIPLVSYEYLDIQKKEIYKENKGKSGIYLWTNKISG